MQPSAAGFRHLHRREAWTISARDLVPTGRVDRQMPLAALGSLELEMLIQPQPALQRHGNRILSQSLCCRPTPGRSEQLTRSLCRTEGLN